MYLGPAFQLRPRTWVLLFAAGVLLASGRGEAASLAGPAPAAELVIRGEVAELRLRGLDPAALRQRLAGATPRLEIHVDGRRLLVAELAELTFADEAPLTRASIPPPIGEECLGLDLSEAALEAALRTSAVDGDGPRPAASAPKPDDEAGPVVAASLQGEWVTVPEPSTAPLLGAGLLALLLVARRL